MKTTHIKNLLTGTLYPATDFHFSTNQINYVDPGTEYSEEFTLMNTEWEYVEQEIIVHNKTKAQLIEESNIRKTKLQVFRDEYWENKPEPIDEYLEMVILSNSHESTTIQDCINKEIAWRKEQIEDFDAEWEEETLEKYTLSRYKLINKITTLLTDEQREYMNELLIFVQKYEKDKIEFEKTL